MKTLHCVYPVKVPHQGASNEYSQHVFAEYSEYLQFLVEKVPYLKLWLKSSFPLIQPTKNYFITY